MDYTDTIPYYSKDSLLYYSEPTEIAFVKERMFISTNRLGVLEWNKEKGWIQISTGLIDSGADKLYRPVVFLESINETLIAVYGEPGYAPWGGLGVYKLKLK